ncbi:MAG: outer membrane lipopolysaccharide assembly protein LptE/RlpB [Bermanella sp.]|jgi:outer membrane lipopolysaccharide assembly protein LptE/RlpB
MRALWLGLISLLLVQLGACGFHLRGAGTQHNQYPPVVVEQNHGDNALRRLVSQQLAVHGIKDSKVSSNLDGELSLRVSDVSRGDTVLSLDANIRTAERTLGLSAKLSLLQHDAQPIDSVILQEQRILFTNPDNPVGNSTEQSLLVGEMETAMARRIAEQATRWLDREQANAATIRPAR